MRTDSKPTPLARCSAALSGALVGLGLCAQLSYAAPPRDAQTHEQRLMRLYGHDPSFTAEGEPIISVGIIEGLQSVKFYSKRGFKLYPAAEPDSAVELKSVSLWELSLREARAEAQVERWELLDERPVSRASELNELEELWRSRGVKSIVRFQSGLYLPGGPEESPPALEARSIMLAHRPHPELDLDAQLKGRRLSTLETLVKPARGLLSARGYEAKSPRSKLKEPVASLTAPDLFWIESRDGRPITVTYENAAGKEQSARYHNELYVIMHERGLSVVSVLPTERLIEGVVPSELYRSAPMEALKAQAIAARGQVVVKLGARHLADPFMLCASTHCQAYKGVDQHHKRTSAAVRETRGEVAMTSEGQPLDSVYSSTCGGHTEAYHEVWGGAPKPNLLGVEDNALGSKSPVSPSSLEAFIKAPTASFCQEPKRTFRWSVRRSAPELLERLVAEGHVQKDDFGDLSSFEVLRRGVSGRAHAVTYRGTRGSVVVYGDYANRLILGLKSGLWVSETLAEGRWRLSGGGFGHGVGMCQHGAMGMAKGGASAAQILSHYYGGAEVRTLW